MQLETWSIEGQGFHFGRHGMGQEESGVLFTSDSMLAALIATLANSQGAMFVSEFVHLLQATPPAFVISSVFPRAGKVRFFPIPRWVFIKEEKQLKKANIPKKAFNKAQFVSEIIFRKLIAGDSLVALLPELVQIQQGVLLLSKEETKFLPNNWKDIDFQVWRIEQRPRVIIGRESQKTSLYHTGGTWFAPDCGLWFAIKWNQDQPEIQKLFHNLLLMLGDAGLGGERSSGFGRFTPTRMDDIEFPAPDGTNHWVTLSRYLPAEDEITALLHSDSVYQLERVGGWTDSSGSPSQRRKVVQMLSEGSVFGPIKKTDPGLMVDVQPEYDSSQPLDHAVWRSGIALAVGLKERGDLS